MRVLAATTAGAGHLGPLASFAGALRDAGHEVVIAAPASFAAAVERAGFSYRPVADAPPGEVDQVFAGLRGVPTEEANAAVIGEVFGRIDTRAALPGMRALAEEWQPDLILREGAEFASYVVADQAGIPHAEVAVGLEAFMGRFLHLVEDPLQELGCRSGVAGMLAAPHLSLLPPSFEDPSVTSASAARRFRDDAGGVAADEPLPDWWDGSTAPLVYVTFGTVAGAGFGVFPTLYQQVITALSDLPIRVLVTIGRDADPGLLDPLPANAHVEQWWPQRDVMAHASAMVGHGGMGTTLAGLAAGMPAVIVPLFADQPSNARRVAAVGAGIALEGGPSAVGALPDAVQRVLDDETYRDGARRVANEIAGLPPLSACVPFLEQVAQRQP